MLEQHVLVEKTTYCIYWFYCTCTACREDYLLYILVLLHLYCLQRRLSIVDIGSTAPVLLVEKTTYCRYWFYCTCIACREDYPLQILVLLYLYCLQRRLPIVDIGSTVPVLLVEKTTHCRYWFYCTCTACREDYLLYILVLLHLYCLKRRLPIVDIGSAATVLLVEKNIRLELIYLPTSKMKNYRYEKRGDRKNEKILIQFIVSF